MAVIAYRCTDCDREIQIIEQAQGLETFGRCIITNKCRGNLYRVKRHQDYTVGNFPDDVTGLTNWIQRNVVYNHTQAITDTTWTITHNLGVNPSVQVLVDRQEGNGSSVTATQLEIQPETVTIVDENTLLLTFDRPESGLAQVIARSTRSTELVEAVEEETTYLPVTVDGILTIAIDCESGQFPATSATENTVRLYFLDQEELDATALESAAFKDYAATTTVDTTSAWSDVDEIFVNGDVYTVMSIDIGDPVTDFDAPTAGAVLFQFGKSTSGFPYDQAPNMVVLLSNPPHLNADKNRRRIFRPDLETGPALTLDSFIFANGELVVDIAATEEPFPPIYTIDAPQDCGYVEVVPVVPADPAFVITMTDFSGELTAESYQFISDDDITTWTQTAPIPGTVGGSPQAFFTPLDMCYMTDISTWVGVSQSSSSRVFSSADDGVSWQSRTPAALTTHYAVDTDGAMAVAVGGFTGGGMATAYTTDGINWSLGNGGGSVIPGGNGRHIRYTGDRWIALDSNGNYWTMTDPTIAWPAAKTGPDTSISTSSGTGALHSINAGSRVFFGADSGTVPIWYSDDDGDTWNSPSFSNPVTASGISTITAFADDGDGTLVATGNNYGLGSPRVGYCYVSTDSGLNWTQTLLPINGGVAYCNPRDVIYDPDYGFVVVGSAFFSGASYDMVVLTSPDGSTWTTRVAVLGAVYAGQPDPQFVISKLNNLIT